MMRFLFIYRVQSNVTDDIVNVALPINKQIQGLATNNNFQLILYYQHKYKFAKYRKNGVFRQGNVTSCIFLTSSRRRHTSLSVTRLSHKLGDYFIQSSQYLLSIRNPITPRGVFLFKPDANSESRKLRNVPTLGYLRSHYACSNT